MSTGRASAFFQSDDLDVERVAEEAAQQAGKSVEAWLHDLILEQGGIDMAANLDESAMAEHDDALFDQLAARVKTLESALDRASPDPLIARAAPPRSQASSRKSNQEHRLATMLKTIDLLEQKLSDKSAAAQAHQAGMNTGSNTGSNDGQAERLKRLEMQLGSIETHLREVATQASSQDAAAEEVMDVPSRRPRTPKPQRPKGPASSADGRRAYDETLSSIAQSQNGFRVDNVTYKPKDRPVRSGAGRRGSDKHFETLSQKIDVLQEGMPDLNRLSELGREFSTLREEMLTGQRATMETVFADVQSLRDTLSRMQVDLADRLDDQRLAGLEQDINRVAEFLVQSPDLTAVPATLSQLSHDVSRISDGILAAMDKTETSAREQRDQLGRRLDESLKGLRDEIIAHVKVNRDNPTASVPAHFEERLIDIQSQIVGQMGNIQTHVEGLRGQVFDMEDALLRDVQKELKSGTEALVRSVDPKLTRGFNDLKGQLDQRIDALKTHVSKMDAGLRGDITAQLKSSAGRVAQDLQPQLDQRFGEIKHRLSGSQSHMDKVLEDLRGRVAKLDSGLRHEMVEQVNGGVAKLEERLEPKLNDRFNDLNTSLQGMESHLDQSVDAIRGQMFDVGNRVIAATERLEALSETRGGEEDLSDQLTAMEKRLVDAAERLEQASVRAAESQGEVPAALLQMPTLPDNLLTEDMLEQRINALSDMLSIRLADTKAQVSSEDLERLVTHDDLRGELNQLTQIITGELQKATQPADSAADTPSWVLSSDHFDARLDQLADKITATLKDLEVGRGEMPDDLVTEDRLRNGLTNLAAHLTNQLTAGQSDVMSRLETAIQAGESGSGVDGAELAALIRQSAEDTVNRLQTASASPETADLADLRRDFNDLRAASTILSDETRSSFSTVQDILQRVSGQLTALEEKQVELSQTMTAERPVVVQTAVEAEVDAPAAPASDEEELVLEPSAPDAPQAAKDVVPAPVEAASDPEEDVFARMRRHVKARDPDAPLLQPGEDDVPLAPGSGRPAMAAPAEQEPNAFATDDAADPNPPQSKTKADFIAAARRAAQAAAAEEAALEIDPGAKPSSRKSLASIRERINEIARGAGSKAPDPAPDPVEDTAPSVDPSDTAEATVEIPAQGGDEALKSDAGNDAFEGLTTADSFTEPEDAEMVFEEPRKGSLKRKLLMLVLAAAIAGPAYILYKNDVVELYKGLMTSNVPDAAAIAPGSTTAPDAPAFVTEPVADPNLPTAQDGAAEVQNPAVALPSGDAQSGLPLPSADVNDTVSGTSGDAIGDTIEVDATTTQSISSDGGLPADVGLPGFSIYNALEDLPEGLMTTKLASALDQRDPKAYAEIGRRFSEGVGTQRDLKQAAYWYEQAAAQNLAVAQFRVGTLYEDGLGVPRDDEVAHQWYRRAADNGNARAMHNLAVGYAEGAFGQPDFKRAYEWFTKGAAYGITDSQFNLGILYVRGLGVESDLKEAYKWFDVAAKSGDRDAAGKRDEVAKALSGDALTEAKAISRSWQRLPWDVEANVITPNPSAWADEASGSSADSALIREAQTLLSGLGFDAGSADGLV
ncbi:MAG: hypothetical protein AAFW47_05920, partial [Pseudomonadota bacterium]